jgi:late competence protein required for DNA uptake (superfamily II DNA/RNA helicase)
LSDYQYFHNEKVPVAKYTQPWPFHEKYNTKKISNSLEAFIKKAKTAAYLVIKNDSLFLKNITRVMDPIQKVILFQWPKV